MLEFFPIPNTIHRESRCICCGRTSCSLPFSPEALHQFAGHFRELSRGLPPIQLQPKDMHFTFIESWLAEKLPSDEPILFQDAICEECESKNKYCHSLLKLSHRGFNSFKAFDNRHDNKINESGQPSQTLRIVPADQELIDLIKKTWPMKFSVDTENNRAELTVQTNNKELWKVVQEVYCGTEEQIQAVSEMQKALVPLALTALARETGTDSHASEALIAMPYASDKDGSKLLLLPVPNKTAHSDKQTVEITEWPVRSLSFNKDENIGRFLRIYQTILNYLEIPMLLKNNGKASPTGPAKNMSPEFMMCANRLVNLQEYSEIDSMALRILTAQSLVELPNIHSKFSVEITDDIYDLKNGDICVSTTLHIDMSGERSILVPGLIGTINVDDVGWDGQVLFKPAGLNVNLRVEPVHLKKISCDITDEIFDRNQQLWDDRIAEANKNDGQRILLIHDRSIKTFNEWKQALYATLMQAAKFIEKKSSTDKIEASIIRIGNCLKAILQTPKEQTANQYLKLLKEVSNLQEFVHVIREIMAAFEIQSNQLEEIISHSSFGDKDRLPNESGSPVTFIDDKSMRRDKRRILYEIACRLEVGRRYQRQEIEDIIIEKVTKAGRISYCGYDRDNIRRNMVDTGYLDRDPYTETYWLCQLSATI